jgi:beta-lactam-binding protein with PASTA domain
MRTRPSLGVCPLIAALTLVSCSVAPGGGPTEPPPVEVVIPHVVGMGEARALGELEQAGLQGLVIERKPSTGRPGEILWQRPKATETVLEGAVVRLVVAEASPRPDVLEA